MVGSTPWRSRISTSRRVISRYVGDCLMATVPSAKTSRSGSEPASSAAKSPPESIGIGLEAENAAPRSDGVSEISAVCGL